MTAGLVAAAYLVSGIFFVLSLGGLSKQESARKGNLYGILGMALAIIATFVKLTLDGEAGEINFQFLVPLMIGGAIIGTVLAKRVEMTSMPELVAILHSFVGAAAVLDTPAATPERRKFSANPSLSPPILFSFCPKTKVKILIIQG